MKNQWPFWLFVLAIVIVVVISLNYQGKNDVVSLGEIFPEEPETLDYEYVTSPDQTQIGTEDSAKVESSVEPSVLVKEPDLPSASVKPVVVTEKTSPAQPTAITAAYVIQVLSSKELKATETSLKKVKENGFADAYVQSVNLGDKGIWYRIYIGQYSSMDQAKSALTSVKEKYTSAFITKP